jgi:hypothetical protein
MKRASLHCAMRRLSMVAVALLGTYFVSAPVSNAQTVYAITNWDGTILPSAASLYTRQDYCYNPTYGVTVCTWVIRKLYGDNSAVIAVAHYPNGAVPACNSGVTQHITSGYSRSFCSLTATAAVYGQ